MLKFYKTRAMVPCLHVQTASYSRAAAMTASSTAPPFSSVRAQGEIIDGTIPMNADFVANKAHMDGLMVRHNALIDHILLGGGEKAQGRLKKRNKLFVRKR